MAKTSPTQRAKADMKKLGWTHQVVEHWNAFAKVRQDLFGVIDIVVLTETGILGVQVTSGAHHAERREKALESLKLALWLKSGGRFEIWSYAQRGDRGKRKLWTLRREAITLEDMPEDSIAAAHGYRVEEGVL